ncbi:hypothetical protein Airi01_103180 [Actinoallomurus iriomotensis]|uniref:Uncharacterized protein n=2 Tax=Actinoallomurus iriomotensis TaxID=478107 RepID=A0A9W6RUE7_9ACTN|nr:hypothetical protein Airi01_103180 [Actinoallomurus iriomotensis]
MTSQIHEMAANDVPARQTITIEIEPGDDPIGIINGLVLKNRLDAVLRLLGNSFGSDLEDGELWDLMVSSGYFANLTESKVNDLMWAARDTHGMSWRKIARAFEMHQSTIRRRVAKLRREYAEQGIYRTASGVHRASKAKALEVLADAESMDAAER